MDYYKIGQKIRKYRKLNGLSQEELAEKINVSRQAVSKWEGAQSIPDLEKVLQLANLFGVTTDYLLKDEIEDADTAEESPIAGTNAPTVQSTTLAQTIIATSEKMICAGSSLKK